MKKVLKWAGIIVFLLIAAVVIFAFLGKDQTANLTIGQIDLSKISDGTYTGNYDCYRWSNQVEVTVQDHQITEIQVVKIQAGRESLVETLTKEILDQQTPAVDAVTGATVSSKAFLKAVELALSGASE